MARTKRRGANYADWRSIENDRDKYAAYLCSREWAVLKEAVHKRSGGKCERCRTLPGNAVHHLTYQRKYEEELEDLQHICNACHEFTHGKSEFDPDGLSRTNGGWAHHQPWVRYLLACIAEDGVDSAVESGVAFFGWSPEAYEPALEKDMRMLAVVELAHHLAYPRRDDCIAVGNNEGSGAPGVEFYVSDAIRMAMMTLEDACGIARRLSTWIAFRCPGIHYELYDESICQVRKCL